MKAKTFCNVTVISLVISLAIGCGLGESTPPGGHKTDAGPTKNDTGPKSMQKPMIDPVSGTVCATTVPLQGTAPAGASVFVVGGATTGLATDSHSTTGRFCMDVPLNKNTTNTLQIRAQDPILGVSAPVTITVKQDDCKDDIPKDPPTTTKSKNVALGATAKASETAALGNEAFLLDGKTSTFTQYSGGTAWMAFDGWVMVKLDTLYMLNKLVIKWKDGKVNGGGNYGESYRVLISSMTSPGDPNLTNGYWTEVATITDGDGDSDTHNLKGKPLVQYVAIWLEQDANTWTWTEYFDIAEIEAWDEPKKSTNPTTTPTGTNTCSAIGS